MNSELPWYRFLGLTDDWKSSNFESVRKMLHHLWIRKSGSLQSIETHCFRVAKFCEENNITPDDLVNLSREKIEKLVGDYCDKCVERSRLKRSGRSVKYANTVLSCLKTFFTCNGFNRENGLELRLKGYHQPPRTRNLPEYIPTLKEAFALAERSGSKRNIALILTAITTGLRNTALRALRVSDILTELNEGIIPLLVKIDAHWNDRIPGACKNCIPYYAFICAKATEAIRAMLEERENIFGSYSPDEPLFISTYNQIGRDERRKRSLTRRELEIIVIKAAEAANIKEAKYVHVHTLRKVYETVLRSPLVDGDRMDPKDQEFLMGHLLGGSQDNYYDSSKTERLRELYAKLIFEDRTQDEIRSARKLATLVGLDAVKLISNKEREVGRSLSIREQQELLEKEIKTTLTHNQTETTPRRRQMIIPVSELRNYIANGWEYVPPPLPDDTAVVQRDEPNPL